MFYYRQICDITAYGQIRIRAPNPDTERCPAQYRKRFLVQTSNGVRYRINREDERRMGNNHYVVIIAVAERLAAL
ncbi:MAG: hypothetical protein LBG27_11765 [Spirochaetaceae bacterium]|nr:hypothetical protein [Spirochaetaceae bacterium]